MCSDSYRLSQIPQLVIYILNSNSLFNHYSAVVQLTVLRRNLEDGWSVPFNSPPKVGKTINPFFTSKN